MRNWEHSEPCQIVSQRSSYSSATELRWYDRVNRKGYLLTSIILVLYRIKDQGLYRNKRCKNQWGGPGSAEVKTFCDWLIKCVTCSISNASIFESSRAAFKLIPVDYANFMHLLFKLKFHMLCGSFAFYVYFVMHYSLRFSWRTDEKNIAKYSYELWKIWFYVTMCRRLREIFIIAIINLILFDQK